MEHCWVITREDADKMLVVEIHKMSVAKRHMLRWMHTELIRNRLEIRV